MIMIMIRSMSMCMRNKSRGQEQEQHQHEQQQQQQQKSCSSKIIPNINSNKKEKIEEASGGDRGSSSNIISNKQQHEAATYGSNTRQ